MFDRFLRISRITKKEKKRKKVKKEIIIIKNQKKRETKKKRKGKKISYTYINEFDIIFHLKSYVIIDLWLNPTIEKVLFARTNSNAIAIVSFFFFLFFSSKFLFKKKWSSVYQFKTSSRVWTNLHFRFSSRNDDRVRWEPREERKSLQLRKTVIHFTSRVDPLTSCVREKNFTIASET